MADSAPQSFEVAENELFEVFDDGVRLSTTRSKAPKRVWRGALRTSKGASYPVIKNRTCERAQRASLRSKAPSPQGEVLCAHPKGLVVVRLESERASRAKRGEPSKQSAEPAGRGALRTPEGASCLYA